MEFPQLSTALHNKICNILDSESPIQEIQVQWVVINLQKLVKLDLNKEQAHQFLDDMLLLFVILNRYAKQFDINVTRHKIRMSLEAFLSVIDSRQICKTISRQFFKIVKRMHNSHLDSVIIKEFFRSYMFLMDNSLSGEILPSIQKDDTLVWMYNYIQNIDDLETKAIVIEVMIKCNKFIPLKGKFPEFEILEQEPIERGDIYQTLRTIINRLHQNSSRFFSVKCTSIELNGSSVMKNRSQLWLDVDLDLAKIYFFCDQQLIGELFNVAFNFITTWELVSFFPTIACTPTIEYDPQNEELNISLKSMSSLSFISKTQYQTSQEITFVVSKYADKFKMFVQSVLPVCFPAQDFNALIQEINVETQEPVDHVPLTNNERLVKYKKILTLKSNLVDWQTLLSSGVSVSDTESDKSGNEGNGAVLTLMNDTLKVNTNEYEITPRVWVMQNTEIVGSRTVSSLGLSRESLFERSIQRSKTMEVESSSSETEFKVATKTPISLKELTDGKKAKKVAKTITRTKRSYVRKQRKVKGKKNDVADTRPSQLQTTVEVRTEQINRSSISIIEIDDINESSNKDIERQIQAVDNQIEAVQNEIEECQIKIQEKVPEEPTANIDEGRDKSNQGSPRSTVINLFDLTENENTPKPANTPKTNSHQTPPITTTKKRKLFNPGDLSYLANSMQSIIEAEDTHLTKRKLTTFTSTPLESQKKNWSKTNSGIGSTPGKPKRQRKPKSASKTNKKSHTKHGIMFVEEKEPGKLLFRRTLKEPVENIFQIHLKNKRESDKHKVKNSTERHSTEKIKIQSNVIIRQGSDNASNGQEPKEQYCSRCKVFIEMEDKYHAQVMKFKQDQAKNVLKNTEHNNVPFEFD